MITLETNTASGRLRAPLERGWRPHVGEIYTRYNLDQIREDIEALFLRTVENYDKKAAVDEAEVGNNKGQVLDDSGSPSPSNTSIDRIADSGGMGPRIVPEV